MSPFPRYSNLTNHNSQVTYGRGSQTWIIKPSYPMSRSIRPIPHLTIHHPRPAKRPPVAIVLLFAVMAGTALTLLLSLLLGWLLPL